MEHEHIALTKFSKFAGCGAKLGPGLLDKALCGLTQPYDANLISDFSHAEDCGVYRLTDDLAIVQTIDFFPPICDDPWTFGRIAAANALSDIYAMGATPITAVSVVCFPDELLDISYLREIMEGAMDALKEAQTSLVGGHSIRDQEVKFGLCVNGTINPKRVLRNNTWKKDEVIILSKPIGVGIINTAARANIATQEEELAALNSMKQLNKTTSEILLNYPISSCTDVTGFGLLGHACEMATENPIGACIDSKKVPIIGEALTYAQMGLIPAGAYKNIDHRGQYVTGFSHLEENLQFVLFDPQTSGGLLFTTAEKYADEIIQKLQAKGIDASIIGHTDHTRGDLCVQ